MTLRQRILEDIAAHPGASISAIAHRLALDLHVVSYYLTALRRDGLIGYSGPRHQAAWSRTEAV